MLQTPAGPLLVRGFSEPGSVLTGCAGCAGSGLPKVERAPAIIVTFIGTPGMGKTTIAKALVEALPRAGYRVVHHHSDVLRGQRGDQIKVYWPRTAELSIVDDADSRPVVVIADKNLVPSPEGEAPSF